MKLKRGSLLGKTLKVFSYAKPHWRLFVFLFIISLFTSLLALVNPYLQKILFDDVLLSKKFNLLFILAFAFLLAYLLERVFGIFSSYQEMRLSQKMTMDLKTKLFKHVENLHLGFFYKKKTQDILSRIGQVESIRTYVGTILSTALLNSLRGFALFAVAISMSWKATLLTVLFYPAYLFVEKWANVRRIKYAKVGIRKNIAFGHFMYENLSNIRLIKEFAREKEQMSSFKHFVKKLQLLQIKSFILDTTTSFVTGFVIYIPSFIILFYGSYQVMLGLITLGTLMALRSYVQGLFGPIMGLAGLRRELKLQMVSVSRVLELFDLKPAVKEKEDAIELKNVKGEIEFKNVDFAYEPKVRVLEHINFKIKKGEKVGIVGASGAGKSTVANLLLRFYDPCLGEVLIDGNNIEDVTINSLRNNIGIVSQDTLLLNATIKENLRFAKPNASDEEIVRAAKLAKIHDFIMSLPRGYHAMVGSRGVNLSGGQKQRMSIARVILKDPKIVILDEATSSLDTKTEQEIQEAIDSATKDKTVLIVAHRLSTIRNVNRIIMLEDKRIIEEGSFSTLMAKKGRFYELYNAQFNTFDKFNLKLDEEIDRAKKFNHPLSFVIMDISKMFEGKPAGFLREINPLLESKLRKFDIYSEVPNSNGLFFIGMPETSPRKAQEIISKFQVVLKQKINFKEKIPVYYIDLGAKKKV